MLSPGLDWGRGVHQLFPIWPECRDMKNGASISKWLMVWVLMGVGEVGCLGIAVGHQGWDH